MLRIYQLTRGHSLDLCTNWKCAGDPTYVYYTIGAGSIVTIAGSFRPGPGRRLGKSVASEALHHALAPGAGEGVDRDDLGAIDRAALLTEWLAALGAAPARQNHTGRNGPREKARANFRRPRRPITITITIGAESPNPSPTGPPSPTCPMSAKEPS